MTIPVPRPSATTLRAGVAHTISAIAQHAAPALAPGQDCPAHHEPVHIDPHAVGYQYCPARGEPYRMRPASCCPVHPALELVPLADGARGLCPADGRSWQMETPEAISR
jgi:hypothetical protein